MRAILLAVFLCFAPFAIAGASAAEPSFPTLSGRVVDFLLFYIGDHQWPAFNVADSAIVVGAGLLVIEILFSKAPATEKSA